MQIPFLDLKSQYVKLEDEIKSAINEVLDSQRFILGPKVEELEMNIADYSGTKHAVGISSGTDALLVSLMALDVKPGDEIITTPFTFFSTSGTISRLFAVPKFIDIDPVTFNIDPARIESAITDKTKAIIPVHLFGQCADMDSLLEIANKYHIPVIEDAAQSIGAEYKGRKAGSMGHLGIFSFFPSKNLGGYGDGGMVVTDSTELYEKIKILRVHGSKPKYFHKIVGGNFRLDAIQAAILNVKLKYLDQWSQGRRDNADYYDSLFADKHMVENGYIHTPKPIFKNSGDPNYHIYNQYSIRAKKRDLLKAYLKDNHIGTEIYYPLPLHLQECYRDLGYQKGDLPKSEKATESVLSLPVYPELTGEQMEYVVKKIVEYYEINT